MTKRLHRLQATWSESVLTPARKLEIRITPVAVNKKYRTADDCRELFALSQPVKQLKRPRMSGFRCLRDKVCLAFGIRESMAGIIFVNGDVGVGL